MSLLDKKPVQVENLEEEKINDTIHFISSVFNQQEAMHDFSFKRVSGVKYWSNWIQRGQGITFTVIYWSKICPCFSPDGCRRSSHLAVKEYNPWCYWCSKIYFLFIVYSLIHSSLLKSSQLIPFFNLLFNYLSYELLSI